MKRSRITKTLATLALGLVAISSASCALDAGDEAANPELASSADEQAIDAVPLTGTTCHSSLFNTCVHVWGTGTYVSQVQGSTSAANPNAMCTTAGTYTGHFETWGPILANGKRSFDKNTPDATYGCNMTEHSTPKYTIDMTLPDSSEVCTKFWWKNGGTYHDTGNDCLQIHR